MTSCVAYAMIVEALPSAVRESLVLISVCTRRLTGCKSLRLRLGLGWIVVAGTRNHSMKYRHYIDQRFGEKRATSDRHTSSLMTVQGVCFAFVAPSRTSWTDLEGAGE